MTTKQCRLCGEVKPLSDFFKQLGKYRARCKKCMSIYRKKYDKTDAGREINKKSKQKYVVTNKYWELPTTLYVRAKASAKQHNKSWDLSKEEYIEMISKPCYYCDDLLNNEKNRGIGLDRIDNSTGYSASNVIRSCGFCNKTRGDRLSVAEMREVAQFIIKIRGIN